MRHRYRRGTGSLAAATLIALLGLSGVPAIGQTAGGTVTPPEGSAAEAAQVRDATLQKTGIAMHHVLAIRKDYAQRLRETTMPAEQSALRQQAEAASERAVTDQGLSLDEYNHVIHLAMADPALKARLMKVESQAE